MKLKIYFSILALIFSSSMLLAQKSEKIKGSKIVTTSVKEIHSFNAIEVEDNLEISLEKGDKNEIKIEADDNLHDIINLNIQDEILIISTSKEVQSFKKLLVKVTYTNDLNLVTAKDESIISAIQEIILDNITFKTLNKSKLFLNVNAAHFILQGNDKSKIELNLKAETAFIELSKNTSLKALINSTHLKCDLYQKSEAILEGDSTNATIRLDNSVELNARNFNIKNANLSIEGNASCSVLADSNIIISAADRAEIMLYGTPKIEIAKLEGEAKLIKKLAAKK